MVSRPHDKDPADDRRADQECGRGMRNFRRPHSGFQPEPGCGRADGGQAPHGGAEPRGSGGPGGDEALGGAFPGQRLRRAGIRRQKRRGHGEIRRGRSGTAGGQAPRLRGKGDDRPGGAGHDPGHPQCGQVHLHQ